MVRIFVYGTLRLPEVRKTVIGREIDVQPDVLKNFRKSKIIINGEAYPIAVYAPSEKVEGACIEVTAQELKLIDEYETSAYKRIEVRLSSGLNAWAYVA